MMNAFLHLRNYRVAIFRCLSAIASKAAETSAKRFGTKYLKIEQIRKAAFQNLDWF